MKKLLILFMVTVFGIAITMPTDLAAQNNCPVPTGLSATNVTTTGAVLNWNAVAPSPGATYNIQYQQPGSSVWSTINNVSSNLYQLGGLTCNSIYIFQVQTACINTSTGVTTLSAWSPLFTFITTACSSPCPAPTGLSETGITTNIAVLSWIPPSPNYTVFNLRYRVTGTTNWINVNGIGTAYTLGNLGCGVNYEWEVQTICSNIPGTANFSAWSATGTFSTLNCPVNCLPPAALTTTSVTANGAVLVWAPPTPVPLSYNLRYKPVSATNWVVVSNATSPYQLGNLVCNTNYEWQVQSVCASSSGAGSVSLWSPSIFFTTTTCPTTCNTPTGLATTNITLYGAVLFWNASPPPATAYQIRYRQTGTLAWTLIGNASSPYQLGNLTCNTGYEWQIRTVCPSGSNNTIGYSPWSSSQSFTTSACNVACPAPTGLATTNISMMGAVLSWSATAPPPSSYQIRYRVLNAPAWTTINNATSPYQLGNLTCATAYEWQIRTVCPSTSGTVVYSAWSQIMIFTTLTCNSSCPVPTALTASNISLTGAVLSWNVIAPGAINFQLRFRIAGSPTWTNINNASNPFQLGNLTCNTAYEWQVRTVCGINSGTLSYSPWSVFSTFSTLPCNTVCPTPTNLSTTGIGLYNATLNWTSTAPAPAVYELRYRQIGTLAWTTDNNAFSPYQLSNLTCNTGYEWQVRTVCGSNAGNTPFSSWSPLQTFVTMQCNVGCPAPVNLTAVNINAQGAQLSWTATAPGSVNYQLRYRINGTLAWTLINNATNPYTLNNLACNTSYQWQVRTACLAAGVVSYSSWSLLSSFTTSGCNNNACAAPIGLTANVNQQGGLLTWGSVTGASTYNVRYRQINTLNYTTATVTATFLQIGNLSPGTVYEWQVQSVCIVPGTGITTLSPWSVVNVFTTPLLLQVYPNPANEYSILRIISDESTNSEIIVRDMFGKIVYSSSKSLVEGENEIMINTRLFNEGWYSVTLNSSRSTSTVKVLISR